MDISKKWITVRQFSRTPVEEEKIQKILEAASIDLGTVWISYFDKAKARMHKLIACTVEIALRFVRQRR